MFSVQVTQQERGAVFTLRGELDFDSMVQLYEAGDEELARGPGAGPVVADCARLTFCDSSGIGGLLRLFQQLAAQERALRLAAVPPSVARQFSVTGLDQVFPVYADADQALAASQGRHGRTAHGTDATARTADGRTADGRTVDARTADGRTVEARTVQARTVQARTVQARTAEGRNA